MANAEQLMKAALKKLQRAQGVMANLEKAGASANELALCAEDIAGQADRVAYWANQVAEIYARRVA